MSTGSLVEPLRRVALFRGLSPGQLSEIARGADRVQFKAGDTIISEGQAADAAILIVSGTGKRTAGPRSDDDTVGRPGILLGEMAMLVETDHSSTIVCEEPVRALKITRERLLELMAADISLADHFVAELSKRLRQLATEIREVSETLRPATKSEHPVIGPALLVFDRPPQQAASH